MSLLTKCPACQTYYRVVPDQLRISDGWVKCGQCGDIFDASLHLIEIDPDAGSPNPASELDAPPETRLEGSPEALAKPNQNPVAPELGSYADPSSMRVDTPRETDQARGDIPGAVGTDHVGAAKRQIEPTWATHETELEASPDVVPQLEFPEDKPTVDADPPPEPKLVRWDDDMPSPAGTDPVFNLRAESAPEVAALEEAAPEAPVTFLREEQVQSVWRKPLVRGGLILLALLLLVMLVGQWVYVERDRLSATRPALKPTLQAFCDWTGCAIQPMRQIEAMTIESVAFNKLEKDTYKLSFLVKNAGEFPLAYPAVELVLTDAQDQAAYRRVLTSSELGSKVTELAAGAEWPVTVDLRIDASDATQRVFGYRLLVFYP
jgi:predicted Zn finger-like uncharacterized protein